MPDVQCVLFYAMKKIIVAFSVVLLVGCRSWSPMVLQDPPSPIEPTLPALQLYAGNEYTAEFVGESEFRLFMEEMESNIMNPYGDKYGSVFYSSRILEQKDGLGFLIASGMTLYFLNVLGMPLQVVSRIVEVEVRIVDLQGRLLAKYKGRDKGSAVVGLYYGYSFTDAYNKAQLEAAYGALKQIRPQIASDASKLREALFACEKEIEEEAQTE